MSEQRWEIMVDTTLGDSGFILRLQIHTDSTGNPDSYWGHVDDIKGCWGGVGLGGSSKPRSVQSAKGFQAGLQVECSQVPIFKKKPKIHIFM